MYIYTCTGTFACIVEVSMIYMIPIHASSLVSLLFMPSLYSLFLICKIFNLLVSYLFFALARTINSNLTQPG